MPFLVFRNRFVDFCECNRLRRAQEVDGKLDSSAATMKRWRQAQQRVADLYQDGRQREVVAKGLADPYFPLTKLRKLNLEEFSAEHAYAHLTDEQMAKIGAEHLLRWAEIFLSIRYDLACLSRQGQVFTLMLQDLPEGSLPKSGWCNFCGSCCEIRGGPPEFTAGFEPPKRWLLYFRGDGCKYQRFCPFLFEYLASAKFFCAIYQVKPKCCWTFDREECEFLQNDLARELELSNPDVS